MGFNTFKGVGRVGKAYIKEIEGFLLQCKSYQHVKLIYLDTGVLLVDQVAGDKGRWDRQWMLNECYFRKSCCDSGTKYVPDR